MGFAESEKFNFKALRQEVQSKVNDSSPGWLSGQPPLRAQPDRPLDPRPRVPGVAVHQPAPSHGPVLTGQTAPPPAHPHFLPPRPATAAVTAAAVAAAAAAQNDILVCLRRGRRGGRKPAPIQIFVASNARSIGVLVERGERASFG